MARAPESLEPAPAPKTGSLAHTLSRLAHAALADGDFAAAEERFSRWAALDPRAGRPHLGLARVARARGDTARAEAHYRRASTADPHLADAWVGLADLGAGDAADIRVLYERALANDPMHTGAHAGLFRVSGLAPARAQSLPEALTLAALHPYDVEGLVVAARYLAEAGRTDEAIGWLETAVGLTDLAPDLAASAVVRLRGLSPDWRERRLVQVDVHADSGARAYPGWRFRQRQLWDSLSRALEPALGTRFVVRSFHEFGDPPAATPLDSILDVLAARTSAAPPGIIALFRGEATPKRSSARRGIARYLGRHLIVRDAPDEDVAQVLAHELLHLYGGVHVLDDLSSLMNPRATSKTVDAFNAAIVQSLASREFGSGGFESNVLTKIDLERTASAYTRALQVNLAFRQAGLTELVGEARVIGPGAARAVEQKREADEHMGDVARFASRLFWDSGRRVDAVQLLDVAANLYGRRTTRGRMVAGQAERLKRRLQQEFGTR